MSLSRSHVVRARRWLAVIGVLASLSAHAPAHARQDTSAAVRIEPGKALDSELAGGNATRYSFVLDADQSATLIVVHRGMDLVLRLFESAPEPAIEKTSYGATGELRLRVQGKRSDPVAFELAAAYPGSPAGIYTVSVEDVGPATAIERQLLDAERHDSRARRLKSAAAYAEALSDAERALALREQALGANTPATARSLLLLAQLNDAVAQFSAAEAHYLRARAVAERSSHRNELLEAGILDSYGANRIALGRFHEAEPLVRGALAIRERLLGPHHFLVAVSLGTLADVQHESGKLREARVTAERALEVASRTYRRTDVALGDFTNRVARAQLAAGDFAGAEQLYRESLAPREAGSANSLAAAESLGGLARVALLANDNVKAEQLHLRTLAIKEKIFGPDHPQVANDVFNLALIHYRRRDYTKALEMNLRALAIREKTLGPSHPVIALTFNNIGLVYWRQLDYDRAEEFFRRSFVLAERLYGSESLRAANPLVNLGIIAKETGHYELAESRYKRALAIKEQHLGANHPDLIPLVESLAILYRDRGEYPRAEELFRRTLGISEAAFGAEHPFIARHLGNVTRLNWAAGNWESAFAAIQRMLAIEERNLPLNLSAGSERQKLAYFEPHVRNLEEAISFHLQQPRERAPARDLAVTTLLQRKGRVLDVLADNLTAFRNRSGPEDQVLLDELARVTSNLAAAVLGDPKRTPVAERQRRAAALAAERERLEIEIHRRSAGYVDASRPLTLPAVRSAVPAGAALIEFFVYRPFDPRAAFESGRQFGPPRYVAYIILRSGDTQWKDLGDAEEIDGIAERFRTALAEPSRTGVTRLATELHQKLMAPLEPLWGEVSHLLISPDGFLNLIPFEALRRADGRYLVEDLAISYVTTGRDLVRMQAPRPPASRTVLFADPAFGEPSAERTTVVPAAGASRPGSSTKARRDFSSAYFAPLAGTATEARRIHALFSDAELRMGSRATETALKELQAPRILHIATHGFFLEEKEVPGVTSSNARSRAIDATPHVENPLLRSGLALAGANLPRTGDDDGILTALEAANLNLWGTKLVTLSACDTGVGVVRNGEGVYGLRRAFFLAGAETLVMSLWPVSDQITREIMTGYYAGLKKGLGRGEALRRMQLQMMKRKGRAHPFYWASFIQAGDWTGLDHRR